MPLHLLRLQRELTEAGQRLAAGATADDLFTYIVPVLAKVYGLRRITIRTSNGYERNFGPSRQRLHGNLDVCSFPIVVHRSELGTLEVETTALTPPPSFAASMRQVCAYFALAFSRSDVREQPCDQSEDWRSLFDEHPAPLVVYDLNSASILAANAAFCEAYGYDPDEIAGQRFNDVCIPDAGYMELTGPDGELDGAVRCRHHRRDGARLDVEVTTRHCMWMGNAACMALINDVTSRTRIERRLVQSEKRLERVQEIGGVGIFEIDLQTGERYWSKEMRRQFGVSEDAPLPTTRHLDFEFIHPDDRAIVKAAYERAAQQHETCRVDHRVIQPSGNVVWVQLQADLDFDVQGKPTRTIGTTVDITDRKVAEQQLGYLAHYDPLTGLANRAHAINRLQSLLRSPRRRGNGHAALLFLDVDHFKTVNDTLGHDVGDQLLIEIGRRLRDATRDDDCVARMGGDEFIIIISEAATPQSVEQIARRILHVLEPPALVGGREIFVSCSIGIALCPPEGIEVESLLSRADMAMYQAKRTGRNRFSVYQDEMLRATVARMELEADLRRALEQQEFFLAYQPIVSVKTRKLTGVEALVRWRHPDGIRMPNSFVPVAEESDLIGVLGEWVLREACRQAVVWRAHESFIMSVNVSRRQLIDPQFVANVLAIIEETGIDPRLLQIEITETALVSDIEKTQQSLVALREAGVRIAIDDFGTGYNSLANLRYSVIDALKIDKSFISDIHASASDIAIAGAVVTAGRSLGVRVVAEGVETEEHYKTLRRLGCDDAQGYWFSKPVEAAEFEERYIRSSSRTSAYSA